MYLLLLAAEAVAQRRRHTGAGGDRLSAAAHASGWARQHKQHAVRSRGISKGIVTDTVQRPATVVEKGGVIGERVKRGDDGLKGAGTATPRARDLRAESGHGGWETAGPTRLGQHNPSHRELVDRRQPQQQQQRPACKQRRTLDWGDA